MKPIFTRFTLLICLLLSLVWLCRDPSWEPTGVFVAALLTYMGLDVWSSFQSLNDHDQALLKQFRILFPRDSQAIVFLREHDFANSFSGDILQPIFDYEVQWRGADYEFCNKSLEKLRIKFLTNIKAFLSVLIIETYAHDNRVGWFTMNYKDFSNPPELEAARRKLNSLAESVVSAHQDFVSVARTHEKYS